VRGRGGPGGPGRPVEYFEKPGGPSLGVFVGEVPPSVAAVVAPSADVAPSVVPAPRAEGPKARAAALPSEHEPEYDPSLCTLDWYSSDLNLTINTDDFCSAKAMSARGFGYMWAGARATQGASRGRVCYEVRVDADQSTEHLGAEACPHVLRCGWSVSASDLQLGEVEHSYGYGGTAKVSENLEFRSYGVKFGAGDVIGCYLDLNTDQVGALQKAIFTTRSNFLLN